MGGPGSTRWRGHRRRSLVEETPCLDLLDPELKEALKLPTASGELDLRIAESGEPAVPVDFDLGPVEPNGTRRLRVDFRDPDGSNQTLILQPVQVGIDRSRWYARCPQHCRRRARKLFLRSGRLEFACRMCAGLQYETAQQHDKRIDDCRRDPVGFMEWRSGLRGLRSALVTLNLYDEALRRGVQWFSPERFLRDLLEVASPQARALVEQDLLRMLAAPRKLWKRRDR